MWFRWLLILACPVCNWKIRLWFFSSKTIDIVIDFWFEHLIEKIGYVFPFFSIYSSSYLSCCLQEFFGWFLYCRVCIFAVFFFFFSSCFSTSNGLLIFSEAAVTRIHCNVKQSWMLSSCDLPLLLERLFCFHMECSSVSPEQTRHHWKSLHHMVSVLRGTHHWYSNSVAIHMAIVCINLYRIIRAVFTTGVTEHKWYLM